MVLIGQTCQRVCIGGKARAVEKERRHFGLAWRQRTERANPGVHTGQSDLVRAYDVCDRYINARKGSCRVVGYGIGGVVVNDPVACFVVHVEFSRSADELNGLRAGPAVTEQGYGKRAEQSKAARQYCIVLLFTHIISSQIPLSGLRPSLSAKPEGSERAIEPWHPCLHGPGTIARPARGD